MNEPGVEGERDVAGLQNITGMAEDRVPVDNHKQRVWLCGQGQ